MVTSRFAFAAIALSLLSSLAARADVAVILSSAHELPLRDGKSAEVGVYLNELMIPAMRLLDENRTLVFYTPDGKPPVFDPSSDEPKAFGTPARYQRAKKLVEELKLGGPQAKLHPFSELAGLKLEGIEGVFVPGGHAPLIDLAVNRELGAFLKRAHAAAVPTGLICHGPIALVSSIEDPAGYLDAVAKGDRARARKLAASWPYRDYPMTIFSTPEEKTAEAGKLKGKVRFYPEDALADAGGRVSSGGPGASHVVRHRELITAQNPGSADDFARALAKLLQSKSAP